MAIVPKMLKNAILDDPVSAIITNGIIRRMANMPRVRIKALLLNCGIFIFILFYYYIRVRINQAI